MRVASVIDALEAANNLRKADIEEMLALGYENPTEALTGAIAYSEICYVDTIDGSPEAFMGVLEDGCIWCVTTDEYINNHTKRFIALSKDLIEILQIKYETLWNHVYINNTKHIRWLRRMGFTLEDPKPYGSKGNLFIKFTRK